MPERVIEVLSVTRATDAATGDSIVNVLFGHLTPLTDAMKASITVPPNAVMPKKAQTITLSLFWPFAEECPYRVGSKWALRTSETGHLELVKAK